MTDIETARILAGVATSEEHFPLHDFDPYERIVDRLYEPETTELRVSLFVHQKVH